MSAAGDEITRRKQEARDTRLATQLYETRIRLFDTLERFDFESREIHPMEQRCWAADHPLGWRFHAVPGMGHDRVLICAACFQEIFHGQA